MRKYIFKIVDSQPNRHTMATPRQVVKSGLGLPHHMLGVVRDAVRMIGLQRHW